MGDSHGAVWVGTGRDEGADELDVATARGHHEGTEALRITGLGISASPEGGL